MPTSGTCHVLPVRLMTRLMDQPGWASLAAAAET